jgi:hypothetical protein
MTLFVSYDEIQKILPKGNHKLKYMVSIDDGESPDAPASNWHYFNFNNP